MATTATASGKQTLSLALQMKHNIYLSEMGAQMLVLKRKQLGYIEFKHYLMREFKVPTNGAANICLTMDEMKDKNGK